MICAFFGWRSRFSHDASSEHQRRQDATADEMSSIETNVTRGSMTGTSVYTSVLRPFPCCSFSLGSFLFSDFGRVGFCSGKLYWFSGVFLFLPFLLPAPFFGSPCGKVSCVGEKKKAKLCKPHWLCALELIEHSRNLSSVAVFPLFSCRQKHRTASGSLPVIVSVRVASHT